VRRTLPESGRQAHKNISGGLPAPLGPKSPTTRLARFPTQRLSTTLRPRYDFAQFGRLELEHTSPRRTPRGPVILDPVLRQRGEPFSESTMIEHPLIEGQLTSGGCPFRSVKNCRRSATYELSIRPCIRRAPQSPALALWTVTPLSRRRGLICCAPGTLEVLLGPQNSNPLLPVNL